MAPEGYKLITSEFDAVQPGDLYRVREDERSEYGPWQPAGQLAGSEAGYFAAWHSRDIQFCRPAKPAEPALEQPRNFEDAFRRWQQESAAKHQWEMVNDRDYILRPGVDQVRCRTYLNESEHWSEWTDWHTVQKVQTVGGFADGPGGTAAAQEWQFRRRVTDARQAPELEWEPLPLEDDTVLQPGRDEARFRAGRGEWSAWMPLSGSPLSVTFFVAQRPSFYEYEFRRRRNWTPPAPEQPPTPTSDRGGKYHRTITQTLPGDTHGCSVTVDVYDVLQAFGVTCPAAQHAVKKLLCPGLRGSKSAEQDISEAANSCRRAIELLGADS